MNFQTFYISKWLDRGGRPYSYIHISAFPIFSSFSWRCCSFHIHAVEALQSGWLIHFQIHPSPSCSNSLGFIWSLLFFFFNFPFLSGSVLRRPLEIFGLFLFVMVPRDRSWENVQMKIIALFLQMRKRSSSERKPKVETCATETFLQCHFGTSCCLKGVLYSTRRLHLLTYVGNQVAL